MKTNIREKDPDFLRVIRLEGPKCCRFSSKFDRIKVRKEDTERNGIAAWSEHKEREILVGSKLVVKDTFEVNFILAKGSRMPLIQADS